MSDDPPCPYGQRRCPNNARATGARSRVSVRRSSRVTGLPGSVLRIIFVFEYVIHACYDIRVPAGKRKSDRDDRQSYWLLSFSRVRGHGCRGAEGQPACRPLVGSDGMGRQTIRGEAVLGGAMNEGIAAKLAQEAIEAEARAEAEERGDELPSPAQRARKQPTEASQVYTVRVPVGRLEELRTVAERLGEAPSALLRRWALERLDEELRGPGGDGSAYRQLMATIRSFVDQAIRGAIAESGRPSPPSPPRRQSTKASAHPSSVRLGTTRRLKSDLMGDNASGEHGRILTAPGEEK
jgi:hypothetical protein